MSNKRLQKIKKFLTFELYVDEYATYFYCRTLNTVIAPRLYKMQTEIWRSLHRRLGVWLKHNEVVHSVRRVSRWPVRPALVCVPPHWGFCSLRRGVCLSITAGFSDISGGEWKKKRVTFTWSADRGKDLLRGRQTDLYGLRVSVRACLMLLNLKDMRQCDIRPWGYCLMFPGCEFLD